MIILGIVTKEAPSATTLSTKSDFVKRSLDKTRISIAEEEIETALNKHTDERASRQTMLGILLALAKHPFDYDPIKPRQKAITDITNAIYEVRTDETVGKWLKRAAAEVVGQP